MLMMVFGSDSYLVLWMESSTVGHYSAYFPCYLDPTFIVGEIHRSFLEGCDVISCGNCSLALETFVCCSSILCTSDPAFEINLTRHARES
jgi:hypothetical protein